MHNLNTRIFAWILAALAVGVGVVYALATKGSFSEPKFCWGMLSTLATAIFLFGIVFTKWLWKWSPLQGWLVPFPNLNGVWEGEIRSTWLAPGATEPLPPIPAILLIKQSFTKISCVIQTGEMKSFSISGEFRIASEDQLRQVVYSYASDPKPGVRDRSARHYGTAVLEILDSKPRKLTGFYWTDRKSTGEMEFTFQNHKRTRRHEKLIAEHPMASRSTKDTPGR